MGMNLTSHRPAFCFEGFQLDQRSGLSRVTEGGLVPVPLGSRAVDVLMALVDRQGELLTKQELMDAAWPGTVVEDSNLAVQIFSLRRVLDEGRGGASRIQTVIGRGYRFLPEVTLEHGEPPPGPGGVLSVTFERRTGASGRPRGSSRNHRAARRFDRIAEALCM